MRVVFANLLWYAYSGTRARTWMDASRRVKARQEEVLRSLLDKNSSTAFGREHSFDQITTVEEFQQMVPLRTYEEFKPYIDSIADGGKQILTEEPVLRFGVSSGSTSASKLVPYTSALVCEFEEGIDPWMYHLFRQYPRILTGPGYWSVTPVGERERYSKGGIPIGFDDERSYFGKVTQWVLDKVMAAPSELALVEDIDAFRYATLRFLLQEKTLSWLSVWNPSFATLLFAPLREWFDQLVSDVESGSMSVSLGVTQDVDREVRSRLKRQTWRARELARIRDANPGYSYSDLWPRLRLISCWGHGNSVDAIPELRSMFPSVEIQPKGLLATEAFVSFPLSGEVSALSINSHFFEFEEVESGKIALAHELEQGRRYSVIVTTGGGLYRYRLNDVIQVDDFADECPLMHFEGKQDKVVDLRGEKLNEQFVTDVVRTALASYLLEPTFWMVAPDQSAGDCLGYSLYIQFASDSGVEELLSNLNQTIDQALRENFHYNYCRRLGQLAPLATFLIEPSEKPRQVYLTVCRELGQRLGDIKSVALHPFGYWSHRLRGKLVSHSG